MSKRKKGVSLDEKRERILKIYHETLEVYNLKEIEKLGSKAGVVLQTIKDVNQALVDDNLVDSDKIGSGNYFWSFPSKVAQQRKKKLEDLESKEKELKEKIQSIKEKIETQKSARAESADRVEKIDRLGIMKSQNEDMKRKLHVLSENDPDLMEKIEKKVKIAKDGADRWTDNVFNLKSWVIKKNGCSSAEVEKWLGIKDDFDYVE